MKINLNELNEVTEWALGDVIQNPQGVYMIIYLNEEYRFLDLRNGIAFGGDTAIEDLYEKYHMGGERKINAELVEAHTKITKSALTEAFKNLGKGDNHEQ